MSLNRVVNRSSTGVARSQRYEFGTVLRYRTRGVTERCDAAMESISISWVLLRTDQSPEPNTVIEMRFVLPIDLNGECTAEVLCRGSVV